MQLRRRRPGWQVVYLAWAAALMAGGTAAYAAAPCADALQPIFDGACGAPHDPAHDRDHKFHHRCEHYRHRHMFHRGHDGSAQLAVRTLIDSTGMAVLEATTGTFDDGSVPPGSIDELHVQLMHPDRKHHDQLTFKPKQASGYFTAPLGRLVHGQPMTVDAIISGVDRGKDHPSIDDVVQYRPDLAVGQISVPATVGRGLPVSVAATVREMMGDAGATADCLLSADGTVVDRVSNMWVDAGGVVTCHFTATFATTGSHAMHVDVANVRPADYNMSNNGAGATVSVTSPFTFTASVSDDTYSGSDANQVLDTAGNVLFSENDAFSGSVQSISLSGAWAMPMTFPLGAVSARATSGGTGWSIIDLASLAAGSSDPTLGTCGSSSDATGFNWISVCTIATGSAPGTSINISQFAGDVTYHSDGVCQQTTSFADCAGGYTWNTDTSSAYAPRQPLSGSLTVNLSVSDANGASLEAFPVIPLTPYTSQNNVAQSCQTQSDSTQYCYTQQYVETGLRGSVTQ